MVMIISKCISKHQAIHFNTYNFYLSIIRQQIWKKKEKTKVQSHKTDRWSLNGNQRQWIVFLNFWNEMTQNLEFYKESKMSFRNKSKIKIFSCKSIVIEKSVVGIVCGESEGLTSSKRKFGDQWSVHYFYCVISQLYTYDKTY